MLFKVRVLTGFSTGKPLNILIFYSKDPHFKKHSKRRSQDTTVVSTELTLAGSYQRPS